MPPKLFSHAWEQNGNAKRPGKLFSAAWRWGDICSHRASKKIETLEEFDITDRLFTPSYDLNNESHYQIIFTFAWKKAQSMVIKKYLKENKTRQNT